MIRRYTKKPVEVQAMRIASKADFTEALEWIVSHGGTATLTLFSDPYYENQDTLAIQTLEGEMEAKVGHWIIRGVSGEFYPVRNDIFVQTYRESQED